MNNPIPQAESQAARRLVTVLLDLYGLNTTADSNVWAAYRGIMIHEWHLSEAEARCAVLCIQGLTNPQIATQLGKSFETVNKQLDRVFKRLQVRNRTQIATRLLERAGVGLLQNNGQ